MLPILNNDLVWAWKLVMRIPDLKRAVSGPSTPFGLEMVKFGLNFCFCGVEQEKVVFKKETGRFWPICPFGARNGKIYPEFLAADQERAVSSPSALLGPKMVKFCPTFCYCALDQEKVVFKRKRAVSSPSALFGPGRPTRPPGGFLGALGLPSVFKTPGAVEQGERAEAEARQLWSLKPSGGRQNSQSHRQLWDAR